MCCIVTPACFDQSTNHLELGIKRNLETEMFLTAKLNLITGMVIGAATAMVMKQICKDKKKQKGTSASVETLNQQR